ncbi:hypothetical protein [Paenibacillus sp. IHBB 10380]|uniref:hypothetical protein n=1 Tax=Paenibacillus sp. IHBB 10380 TaxID=1566358 RepID=UPI0005CFD918|nr:hypothetical protein [Paenibacillus sp. IHBB 10380]AJS59991.1 hypothetical protein UB51_17660 [Paenibacillus sp. IHBB 10380]
MKKSSVIFVSAISVSLLLLQGCSDNESAPANTTSTQETAKITPEVKPEPIPEVVSEVVPEIQVETTITPEVPVEEEVADIKPEINTSVFVYAEKVEVTDSRDITENIDLVVFVNENMAVGTATQRIIIQTYDFLQQGDIKGAKNVTIGLMSGEFRVFQFTVDVTKFKAGDNFIHSVLDASKIDKVRPDVDEFGKAADFW